MSPVAAGPSEPPPSSSSSSSSLDVLSLDVFVPLPLLPLDELVSLSLPPLDELESSGGGSGGFEGVFPARAEDDFPEDLEDFFLLCSLPP